MKTKSVALKTVVILSVLALILTAVLPAFLTP